MAWTVLSDATLEVGKALRALTMRNLRDNITALANGDVGAPQIQTAAIAANAVTAAKIADNTIPSTRISYPTAGDGYIMKTLWGPQYNNNLTVYNDWTDPSLNPIRCDCLTYGSVRVRFDHFIGGSVSYAWARVIVEHVVVAEWAENNGGGATRTVARVVDVSIGPGQRICIQGHKDPAYPSSGGSLISNARILSNTVAFGVA